MTRQATLSMLERIQKKLPERQIIIRTDGETRLVTVSTPLQVAGIGALGAVILAVSGAFIGVASNRDINQATLPLPLPLQTQITDKQVAFEESATALTLSKSALNSVRAELADSRLEQKRLREQISKSTVRLSNLQKDSEALALAREEADEKLQASNVRLSEIAEEKSALEKSLQTSSVRLGEIAEEKSALEKNLQTSNVQLEKIAEDKSTLEKNLQISNAQLGIIAEEKSALEESLQTSNAQLGEFTEEKAALEEKLMAAGAKLETAKTQRAELEIQVDREEQGNRALASTRTEIEAEAARLRQQIEDIDQQHLAALSTIEILQKQIGSAGEQIVGLQKSVASVEIERDQFAVQLEEVQTSYQVSVEEKTNLSQQLSDAQLSLKDRATTAQKLEGQLNQVTASLAGALQNQRALQAKVESSSPREVEELEAHIDVLRQSQNSLMAQMETSADHNLNMLESVVQKTGIKVVDLLNSLDPTDLSRGGPYLNLSEMNKLRANNTARSGFDPRMNALLIKLNRVSWLQMALNRMPLGYPVENVRMTSKFGSRIDPLTKEPAFHSGLDFAGRKGTPVKAPAAGYVVRAGKSGDYGNLIEIDHGNGINSRYAHLSAMDVAAGDEVEFGQVIGKIGSTGRSTGAHLHYEVTFANKFLNPRQLIKAGRDVFKSEIKSAPVREIVNQR